MKMRIFAAIAAALTLAACTTTDPYTGETRPNYTGRGVLIGAAAGAALGYLTNTSDSEEGRTNALIGAGIGALAGGAVGNYMDRQEQELRQELLNSGVSVSRSGKQIILNMPGNVTFASDSADINGNFYGVLDSVAIVLNKYPQTLLDIDGHTDNTGSAEYNQQLSERRAISVGQYLRSRNVDPRRLLVVGFGETRPIADNSTEFGRQQNRRVEIRITPYEG